MAADTAELSKVDSAVSGLSSSPTEEKKNFGHRRTSSSVSGVYNINDLGKEYSSKRSVLHFQSTQCQPQSLSPPRLTSCYAEKEGAELQIAPETQQLNW